MLWIVQKTRTHIDGIRVDHVSLDFAKGISMPVESNECYEVKDYDHSYMLALSAIKGTGDSPTTWIPVRLRELA